MRTPPHPAHNSRNLLSLHPDLLLRAHRIIAPFFLWRSRGLEPPQRAAPRRRARLRPRLRRRQARRQALVRGPHPAGSVRGRRPRRRRPFAQRPRTTPRSRRWGPRRKRSPRRRQWEQQQRRGFVRRGPGRTLRQLAPLPRAARHGRDQQPGRAQASPLKRPRRQTRNDSSNENCYETKSALFYNSA